MLHVGKSIARTVQSLQNFEILRKKWHEERERRRFDEDYTELQSIYRCVALPLTPIMLAPTMHVTTLSSHPRPPPAAGRAALRWRPTGTGCPPYSVD